MASTSPSPGSSPSSIPPVSSNPTYVPPVSQPDQATVAPLPPATPSVSPPPLQLPPVPIISSPPPDASPPPPPPADVSPPPPPDASPPPLPPDASPPPPPPTLPASPPPSPPAAPPANTPPPLPPPATATPPAAPILSPPPSPSGGSPPPPDPTASPPSPTPPDATPSPPPPQSISPSPPPPENVPSPPASESPPAPPSNPPENPPPNQHLTPPPSALPSNTSINPPSSTKSPPPLPAPTNSSTPTTPSLQLPPSPTEKPTARATNTTTTGRQNDSSGRSPGGSNTGSVVAISLVVGFVTLSLLLMAVWFKQRQKRRNRHPNVNYIMPSPSASSQKSDSQFLRSQPSTHPLAGSPSLSNSVYSPDHGGVGNSRAWFSYEELAEATDGFSGSNLLGEGGFGCVYKGLLSDGREVAVKQLKIGGGQGEREFRAEVEIISRVHHRHLVSLVGYCISEHQRLLVYQYVPNNTLHYHLHGRPVMDWATRIRVAAGAARGLAYLHEDCHPRIIHRDIKSSNILLDDNFDAQVADFGLAKLAMDSNTHVTTRVMGTFGYMAPEYASSGKLTEKSDVFSFGVVVLELITGRKPVDASQPLGDESLVEWARPLLNQALENEDFEELVDPRLGKNYVQVEMFRMIEAAAACIRHLAPKRPRMSQVVRALDSIVEFTTDLSNGMKPGQSEIFDSREHSAQIRLFQRMAFGSQDYSSEYFNNSQTSWQS
ncbi:hypothetical protein L1987_36680 [Smallanthus sonchifolius]|uniref:Uncharacterized protein n=1 Tax=Smallanthus sonchifolius TaxID=185202 RepID=A0ACB9HE90_9ASTR|nr:hypothetical protein L1987_36680 [Smallanthus sonchifolius]